VLLLLLLLPLLLLLFVAQLSNPRANMVDYVTFWHEKQFGLATVAQEKAAKLAGGIMHFRHDNAYCAWVWAVCCRPQLL
jgi:hypothetical protein